MPRNRRVEHPVILGIVGDSAAGKTTLTAGIARILGENRVTTICTDDYHCYDREERWAKDVSALSPDGNYLGILEQHMRLLRDGQPVLKPVYDHQTGRLGRPELVEPNDYIILEGLLGYSTRPMRHCYDVKVYLEPVEGLREAWKYQRDMTKRGYTADQVKASLKRREDDSKDFIQPQRTFADVVVQFYPPDDHSDEKGAHLNVRHTLRPTLPHPDLSPILEVGANHGVRLELSRDIDGKPVDVLEIEGDIDTNRAKGMTDLIWSLIPEAAHMRDHLGEFEDETQSKVQSHPLALSQLLITHHVVKAALGEHAI